MRILPFLFKINSLHFNLGIRLLALFFIVATVGNAQSMSTPFDQGNTAYNNGDFEKAIEHYKEVLASGQHSAALYFNLGNAYYRLNNVGESIYYFEKAKQLDPKDPDIQFNSSFANNMTIDAIDEIPQSQLAVLHEKVFSIMGVDAWGKTIVVFAWIALLCFVAFLFYNKSILKRLFFTAFIILMFFVLGAFLFTFFSHQKVVNTEYAIIFSEQINIWTEPNERADVQFILHEGTKVTLLDTLDEWQKIRIANGSEGWTKNASLRSLK